MSRTFTFRNQAREDIFTQQNWYIEQFAFDIAERFVNSVIDAAQRVLEMPGIGRPELNDHVKLTGLRSWPVPGFEAIRIYYIVSPDTVDIVRVLHSARDIPRILNDET